MKVGGDRSHQIRLALPQSDTNKIDERARSGSSSASFELGPFSARLKYVSTLRATEHKGHVGAEACALSFLTRATYCEDQTPVRSPR